MQDSRKEFVLHSLQTKTATGIIKTRFQSLNVVEMKSVHFPSLELKQQNPHSYLKSPSFKLAETTPNGRHQHQMDPDVHIKAAASPTNVDVKKLV